MRNSRLKIIMLLFVAALFLAQCGGNSPENKTETKLIIQSIVPNYDGTDTTDVDLYQDNCNNGSREKFKKHSATLTVDNHLLPGATAEEAGWVEIESYEVDFKSLDKTLPNPKSVIFAAEGLYLAPGETGTMNIDLVPISTKLELQQILHNAGRDGDVVHYTATVTIWGKTQYGDYLTASKSVTLTFADFDYCNAQ